LDRCEAKKRAWQLPVIVSVSLPQIVLQDFTVFLSSVNVGDGAGEKWKVKSKLTQKMKLAMVIRHIVNYKSHINAIFPNLGSF